MGQPLQELHGELANKQYADLVNKYLAEGHRLILRIEDIDDPERPWCYDVRGARVERGELQANTCEGWLEAWPSQILLDSLPEV